MVKRLIENLKTIAVLVGVLTALSGGLWYAWETRAIAEDNRDQIHGVRELQLETMYDATEKELLTLQEAFGEDAKDGTEVWKDRVRKLKRKMKKLEKELGY